MQSEIQTANIVKILRFAQNDKSEIFRMTLENYDRPSVFRPCEFADEKFRTIFFILVISVHEDVILVSECIYRAMTYTGKLLVTLGYSRSSAVHHGNTVLVEIWACNGLGAAYDYVVCTLFGTAAEIV